MPRLRLLLPLLAIFACVAHCEFVAITSSATPEEALEMLMEDEVRTWLPARFNPVITIVSVSDLQSLTAATARATAVLDLSSSDFETEIIASLCEAYEVPHFVLTYVLEAKPHKWSYYVRGRQRDVAEGLEDVVGHFGWTRVNVVTDSSPQTSSIPFLLKQSPTRSYVPISFPLSDPSSIDRSVGQEMRMTGNRISLFLTSPRLTQSIISAQFSKKIGDIGFGNLMPLTSSLFNASGAPSLETGNLILAEEELAWVSTTKDLYGTVLNYVGSLFQQYTDGESLRKQLSVLFPAHTRSGGFVLLNLQSSRRTLVGYVRHPAVTLNSPIYFLGNTTEVPQNAKSPLYISGNFGVWNVATMSLTAHYYYRGAMLAVQQINSWESMLENFNLELFNFTAGVSVWNYDFAWKNVYPERKRLGLAVMAGTSSGVTMKLISFLSDLNFTGPVIGSSTTVNAFSPRMSYPRFVRTVLADSFITKVYLQMFKRFGWKSCGLFVSNETWGLGFKADFTYLAQSNGIQILNTASLQVLPTPIPSIDTLRNYTSNFLDFIATKARVLIIVVNNNAQIVIDYLYELGVRGGELQVVANEWLAMAAFATNDTETNRRRSELLRGAIQFSPVSFIGPFGSQVRSDYISTYSMQPPVYACFFYDSVLALAQALDLSIRSGQDYTDPVVLLKSLRGSRFVGCTGTVTFSSETNDRAPMQYSILNAQFAGNQTFVTNFSSVGIYDPTSTIVFRFTSNIEWCDGTTKVPEDLRKSSVGCPFEDKYRQEFYQGRYLLYGVCAGIAVITMGMTGVVWRMLWNRSLVHLTTRQEIQLQDVILMIGIFFELVQYQTFGPSLIFLWDAANSLMAATTFEIQSFLSYQNGGFGIVWTLVFAIVIGWVCMCIIVFFQCDYKLEWLPCCRFLGDISESIIPFIGNFLFLPIVSVLMEVFVCTEGVGLSEESIAFTDSYLSEDCYLRCWTGTHLLYVVGSCIVLTIYFPAAAILRPLWQELQEQLNIRTFPLFLMIKTVVQVCLIVFSKTVKKRNAVAHAFLYIGVMGTFLGFSIRFPCFGYRKTQLWHVLSLLTVLWSAGLSLIYQWTESSAYLVFLGMLVGGWGGIGFFGVVYQCIKIPNLLYRKPGVDVANLFRFAFKRATAQILADLRDNFQKIGHRNNVVVPVSVPEAGRRAVSQGENLDSEVGETQTAHVSTKSGLV